MDHSTQVEAVQTVVTKTLTEMGVPDPASVLHTFLIRCGYFVGHKFRCDGISAVWAQGTESVEFYGEDGQLIKTVSLNTAANEPQSPSPSRKTA